VRPAVAVLQLETRHVLAEILLGLRPTGIHQRHLDAGFGKPFRGPAARGSSTYDDDVEVSRALAGHGHPQAKKSTTNPRCRTHRISNPCEGPEALTRDLDVSGACANIASSQQVRGVTMKNASKGGGTDRQSSDRGL